MLNIDDVGMLLEFLFHLCAEITSNMVTQYTLHVEGVNLGSVITLALEFDKLA